MANPAEAPTSSVASDQVTSVPVTRDRVATIEDRIDALEKDVAVLKEAANSYGGPNWIKSIEKRLHGIDGR